MQIAIIVFDGFDELDAIGPYEVFRHAARRGADLDATLVTLTDVEEIVAAGGLRMRPHGTLGEAPGIVLVPGGQGVTGEMERGDLPAVIRGLHESGTTVATVCTGALLAASAGITAGRPATTHHAALGALSDAGAEVIEARVVDDGDLVSAGGVTCGLDLALWLVEREFGADLADAVAAEMEHRRSAVVRRAAVPGPNAGAAS
ncbi:MAG: DJ-1/PfpI family protein [Actinomycetota bacterium]|nr:DJ-1/PfpI family protein [Actinomycetota bacterium]